MGLSDMPHYDQFLYNDASMVLTNMLGSPPSPAEDAPAGVSGSSGSQYLAPQDLVVAAWSFSRVAHKAPQLMARIGEQAAEVGGGEGG